MPTKKTNNPPTPKEPTLQEQAGLPSNWVPIEAAPIVPGAPNGPVAASGAPPSPPNMAPYFTGSIPPALQLSPDLINTQYAGPSTPSFRLMPVGAGGNPAIVAAVQSVIETSGLSQVNLTMPIQYKVSENGSNIIVTWKNVPATWALMGPVATLAYSTPYFDVSNSYSGTSLGGTTIVFGQSLSGWAGTHVYAPGDLIHDSNNNVQRCVVGGTSGGSAPTWPVTVGDTVMDGGVIWYTVIYLISVGDAIIIATDVEQSGVISGISDTSGNIYKSVSPKLTEPTSSTNTEVWAAFANANIAYGSTLSITLAWGTGQTYGVQICTFTNILAPTLAAVQNTVTSATTWSSGTITTSVASALLSVSFSSDSNANTVASPFVIVSDDSPSGSGQICQVAFLNAPTPGAYSDDWTSFSGSVPATVSLIAFPVVTTGSNAPGLPTFRPIEDSDLPNNLVTSVINDTNVTGSIADQELTLGWQGTLAISRGGNGTATPTLTAGTNITITGSWPDYTISGASGIGGASVKTTNYDAVAGDNGSLLAFNTSVGGTWTILQDGATTANFTYPATSTGQSVTFANPCTPGSLILVLFTSTTTASHPTLSDGTNTYNQIGSDVSAGYGTLQAFYAVNSSSSALTVSWSGFTADYPAFQVIEVSGNSGTPFDTSAAAGGAGVTSVSVTTNGSNATPLIVAFAIAASGQSLTPTAGWTTTDSGNNAIFYAAETSSGTYTPSFTTTGSNSGIIAAAFYAAVSSTLTLTLPASPPSSKWTIFTSNFGSGTLAIDPNGLNLDGSGSTVDLSIQNTGMAIFTDGTNYFSMRGIS